MNDCPDGYRDETTRGGFYELKEWLIIIVSVECDDKNYRTQKSATQQSR